MMVDVIGGVLWATEQVVDKLAAPRLSLLPPARQGRVPPPICLWVTVCPKV